MSATDVFDLLGEKIVEQKAKKKPEPVKVSPVAKSVEATIPFQPYRAVKLDKLTTLIINGHSAQHFA